MKIYLFSSTHWDREWYTPFQEFRIRLVDMMNKMIDILENDKKFGVFHLDGQTIVLEDYLEIHPENKERVTELIKSGKLIVGPWYVMPDELLLSGESYIKNLQKGFKIARSYGAEPMKFGYLCDMFGHNSQMPQILKEMGIENALVGRGANDHTTPMHFVWESLSGDGVTTFKLEDYAGYSAFQIRVFRPLLNSNYTYDQVKENIRDYIESEKNRANIPIILLMDADDHQNCRVDTVKCVELIKEMYPEAEVCQQSIEEFCDSINEFNESLPHRQGELVEPTKLDTCYSNLLTNCLSSRYPLKKKNDQMQTRMEKIIDPLFALGGFGDKPYRYVDIANTYLLKNQSHDCICGCSIDQVHEDSMTRYAQTESISNRLMEEYWQSHRGALENDTLVFEILNPLPYADFRTVEAEIWFPHSWPSYYADFFGYERINNFALFDEQGNEIPYGIASIKTASTQRYYGLETGNYNKYIISFAANLKPMAANKFIIKPADERKRFLDYMIADEKSAENKYIGIKFDAFGHMEILDKATGKCFSGLLEIVDDAEIGDGWNHGYIANDFNVTNTLRSIKRIEHTYAKTTFEIEQEILIPDSVCKTNHGIYRSSNNSVVRVIHTVSLGREDKYVTVRTKIVNTAKDHRIRIKFPTAVEGDNYFVNQPFGFVERNRGKFLEAQGWKEPPLLEKQTAGIVTVKSEEYGFAFISDFGLHECGVENNGDIYVTLLRCFNNGHLIDGQIGGQALGEHDYRYILMPTCGNTSLADLQKRQDFLQTGDIVGNLIDSKREVEKSAFIIEGDSVVYSTLVNRDGANELRVYNASGDNTVAKIIFSQDIKSAFLVSLDGKIKKELYCSENEISFNLSKWQIATIRYC